MQGTAPIRGTQSFVGVMSEIWKRPRLTGFEILWRAVAFSPAWILGGMLLRSSGIEIHLTPVNQVAPPSPEQALQAVQSFFAGVESLANPHTLVILAAFAIFWLAFATFGRAFVLRKLDPALGTPYARLFALNLARFALTTGCIVAWVATTIFAFHHFIWMRLVNGGDANVILAFTLVVVSALLLFVLYCVVGWTLQLAPIAAMQRSPRKTHPELRDKLIEINLVMGIVRVCLIVLALVFSACPLPFSNVETQEFLNVWWLGVTTFYILASDYFHVVRAAAYLRLYQTYERTE